MKLKTVKHRSISMYKYLSSIMDKYKLPDLYFYKDNNLSLYTVYKNHTVYFNNVKHIFNH